MLKIIKRLFGSSIPDETVHAAIMTVMLTSMNKYMEEALNVSEVHVPSIYEIREEYKRLVGLGLANSQNAKALKSRIVSHDQMELTIQKANGLIRFVKEIRELFGDKTILISREMFYNICDRYGLSFGLLSDYCGTIPEENLHDISEVKKVGINDIRFRSIQEQASQICRTSDFIELFVTEIVDRSITGEENGYISSLRRHLKRNRHIMKISKTASEDRNGYSSNEFKDFPSFHADLLISVKGINILHNNLFIACPKEYLKNPDIKVSRAPFDPIVFHFCPYGVIVHTAWGDEAEDEVLKRYLELNDRIQHA